MTKYKLPNPDEISKINFDMPSTDWMDTPTNFAPATYLHGAKGRSLEILGFPNARDWSPSEEDWKLPADWKTTIIEGMAERLTKYRSFKIMMDVCVRCGACADKCHFYIGTGDPKNMPVLRAELIRSVYKKYFTKSGKFLGKLAGARDLDEQVLKEWWYYFFQCTECRRCSLYCPYGIDQAEITIIGRELLNLLGLNVHWIAGPVSDCYLKGNHLGLEPHALAGNIEMMVDDIEDVTGIKVEPTFNRKGAEILFITPSGDFMADPGIFACMGYMMLFHELGLDYTWSTYASEGGNFGFFTSNEMAKRLNAKMYAEAERLGVKYIIGGECGHMWRVVHQYMDTWNGPANFLEVPVSPITGTRFDNAASSKIIHISEFTADLIYNKKLKLDSTRNDHLKVTYHDSCNPSRGMGLLEEPRYIIKNTCNNFHEMPENTIREKTFCCGSGSGLNATENMEERLRGGLPRAFAVKYVQEKYGVNALANVCALDRAALPALTEYYAPGVEVYGVTELLANALVMKGEKERTTDLRGDDLPGKEGNDE